MEKWNRHHYVNLLRSIIIVLIGTFMHIFSISITELRYSNLPILKANVASTIFTFSILCILSKARTFWPNKLRKPPPSLLFLCELAFILYATDFLLRHTWLPCLKVINSFCFYLSNSMVEQTNKEIFWFKSIYLAEFVRNDVFFILRLLLSIIVFIIMLDITGIAIFIHSLYRKICNPIHKHNNVENDILYSLHDLDDSSTSSIKLGTDVFDHGHFYGQINFDIRELPEVPPLDLLRPGYLVTQPNPIIADKRKRRLPKKNN